MSKKWYGSLNNRLEEGCYYNGTFNNLQEGTDITMYYYSDTHPYYITKVVNQKNIFVKEYKVCADQHKPGGMGHQNWLLFKDEKEEQEYINKAVKEGLLPNYMYKDLNDIEISEPREWVYRYNKWQEVDRIDLASWNNLVERVKEDIIDPENNPDKVKMLAQFYSNLTDKELEKILSGKTVNKYTDLNGKVSFGIAQYYYDWSF